MTEQRRLERIRQLNSAEQEVKQLRQLLEEREAEMERQRALHAAARDKVVTKAHEMEQLMKRVLQEKRELKAKLDYKPETCDASVQTDSDVAERGPSLRDAAVDATFRSKSKIHLSSYHLGVTALPPSLNCTTEQGVISGPSSLIPISDADLMNESRLTPLPTSSIVFTLELLRRLSNLFFVEVPSVDSLEQAIEAPWHVALRTPKTDWWQWVPIHQPFDALSSLTLAFGKQRQQDSEGNVLQYGGSDSFLECKLRSLHIALSQTGVDSILPPPDLVRLVTSTDPSTPLGWSQVHLPDLATDLRAKSAIFYITSADAKRSALLVDVAKLGDEANLFLVLRYKAPSSRGAAMDLSDQPIPGTVVEPQTHTRDEIPSMMYFEEYLDAQWCPLDWILLHFDSVVRVPCPTPLVTSGTASSIPPFEIKYQDVLLDSSRGILTTGLRLKGLRQETSDRSLERIQIVATTHEMSGDQKKLYQVPCSLVPVGAAFKVMCPDLIDEEMMGRLEQGRAQRTVTVTIKVPQSVFQEESSIQSVVFTSHPVIDPATGMVDFHAVRLPFQISGPYTEVGSSAAIAKSLSSEASEVPLYSGQDCGDNLGVVLFSPEKTPRAPQYAADPVRFTQSPRPQYVMEPQQHTKDASTNTSNAIQYQVDEDVRFKSHNQVLSEMQELQNEFAWIEIASLSRLSEWLNAQATLLADHHASVLDLSKTEFSMALRSTSYVPISTWMQDAFSTLSVYMGKSHDLALDTTYWLHEQARTHREASFSLCRASELWMNSVVDYLDTAVLERVDAYAEDCPKMALSTTQADMVWPGEVELIHQVHRYANTIQELVEYALGRSKTIVDLVLTRNLSFIHHVITTLDERDDQIEVLETRLIKPLTHEKAITARTNNGDIATWCSERCALLLKISTLETYVPDLVKERNELLSYKRKMDAEAASVQFHIDSLNDRCEAMAQECEASAVKLSAATDREKGLVLRHDEMQSRIEMLQLDLFHANGEMAKAEGTKFSRMRLLEEDLSNKTLKIQNLETEIEFLREGMAELEGKAAAASLASVPNKKQDPMASSQVGHPARAESPEPSVGGQQTVAEMLRRQQVSQSKPLASTSANRSRPWAEGAKKAKAQVIDATGSDGASSVGTTPSKLKSAQSFRQAKTSGKQSAPQSFQREGTSPDQQLIPSFPSTMSQSSNTSLSTGAPNIHVTSVSPANSVQGLERRPTRSILRRN